MESVAEYRAKIIEALLCANNAKGEPLFTEEQATKLSLVLSDDQLEDGMPYNSPEEVAKLLIESGLD